MSDQPPGDAFRVARRGYDRDQVDARLAELQARLETLEDDRNQLAAQLAAVGVETPKGVRSELEAVATDVGRVLEAAREAAEAMRSRAADDAARWREAAQVEADDARRGAQQDAVALRGEAWRVGTELLQQAAQQHERILAAAQQDSILTRAEAEQEAHRLTASARKDIADELRLAKLKAERMAEEARLAGEQLRADAHRDVEAAEQRVRAVEQRRAELMREIDAARDALKGLQTELDDRRRALEPDPEPEPVPEEAPAEDARPDWTAAWAHDELAVRIVSQTGPDPGEIVDAEAMAAEVRALRESGSGEAVSGAAEPQPEPDVGAIVEASAEAPAEREALPEPEIEPEPLPDAEPALVAAAEPEPEPGVEALPELEPVAEREKGAEPELEPEPAPEPGGEVEVEAEPELQAVPEPKLAAEPDPEPAPEPELGTEPEPEPAPGPVAELEAEPEAVTEPVHETETGPGGEGIDDLFARLRGGGGAVPAAVVAAEPEPDSEPPPVQVPERPPLRAVPAAVGPDPFELRDRLLLPLTNRALRDAKRAIVDIQNVVLEELRTSGGEWSPEPGAFAAGLAPALAELAAGSRAAGALAAAELSGAAQPPDLAEAGPEGPGLSEALRDGLAHVLERHLESGGGPRQQSAAVSRFFRAWRTDEAERRLRHAAFAAFHGGLIDACAELGVPAIEGVADGVTCAACPASTRERWQPRDAPPNGTEIPPAHDDCECTVVPRG